MTREKPNSSNSPTEDRAEILDHMTRAERIAEMMMMLNEVKDEDMLIVCELIQQVMKKDSPGQ